MPPSFDAATFAGSFSEGGGPVSTISTPHTVGAGSNLFLIATVAWRFTAGQIPFAVSWTPDGGSATSIPLIVARAGPNTGTNLYALPVSAGDGVLTVIFTGVVPCIIGAISWEDVGDVISGGSDSTFGADAFFGSFLAKDTDTVQQDDIVLGLGAVLLGLAFVNIESTWPDGATSIFIDDDRIGGFVTTTGGITSVIDFHVNVSGPDTVNMRMSGVIGGRGPYNMQGPVITGVRILAATSTSTPVNQTYLTPVEGLGGISSLLSTPIESYKSFRQLLTTPLEGRRSLDQALTTPVESLEKISQVHPSPVEGLRRFPALFTTPVEGGASISRLFSSPIEGRERISLTWESPVEGRERVSLTFESPVEADSESLATFVSQLFTLPIEAFAAIAAGLITPVEAVTHISQGRVSAVEARASITQLLASPLEGRANFAASVTSPVEALARIGAALVSPVEGRRRHAALLVSPVEGLARISQTLESPIEADGITGALFFVPVVDSQFEFDGAWLTAGVQAFHYCQMQTSIPGSPAISRLWNITDGEEVPSSLCSTTTLRNLTNGDDEWGFPRSGDVAPYFRTAGLKKYRVELGGEANLLPQPMQPFLVWSKLEYVFW